MSLISFGTNIEAQRKRVRWYNRESSAEVIYEGMPVCYMYDTTTNVLGYDKGAGGDGESQTTPNTTAEGNQNEGRFMIIEKPYTDNQLWFAGHVASGSWVGESVAATSYKWIEIFTANGAIVPVRTDLSCTVGRTILALETDSRELTQPLSANQGRPVAIAEETVDRSSTAGLVLARVCPSEFIYQDNTGDALIAAASGTSNIAVNRINVTSAQTSGTFCALEVKGTSTAGATSSGYGLAFYAEASVTGTVTGHIAGSGIWLNVTGGTPTEYITALEVGLYEDGATMTSAGRTSVLSLSAQVADNVTANSYGWIWLAQNGAQTPDALILGSNLASLPAVAFTGSTTINTDSYGIKVYLANQAGTQQWYIPLIPKLAD